MKPKKLTLQEIHSLYLLLRHSLSENQELYLIDEIEKIVARMESGEILVQALTILFPKKKIDRNNPLELLLLFIQGLKQNDFFEYVSFLKSVKRGGRTNSV